jgi:hypothetical protein
VSLYAPDTAGIGGRAPVDMERCREEVYLREGWGRFAQCARKKAVEVGGIGYCKQHSPEALEKRKEQSRARMARDLEQIERQHRRPYEYMETLQQIDAGHNDPRALAAAVLEKWGDAIAPAPGGAGGGDER